MKRSTLGEIPVRISQAIVFAFEASSVAVIAFIILPPSKVTSSPGQGGGPQFTDIDHDHVHGDSA